MSVPDNVMIAAATFLRFEFWLHDVALQCIEALGTGNITLPPLVCSSTIH